MIVIPMAGLSRRFREAGYGVPKYMLELHGRSLFDRSVSSFAHYFAREPFLFIAREEADTPAFIRREAERLGLARFEIVVLAEPTRGQADTVMLGLREAGIGGDTPLTIFNIDTFRPGFRYPTAEWMSRADGYLEVMPGDDPGWSYARPDPDAADPVVLETAEKVVVSNLASTGLYHFRRAGDFIEVFDNGGVEHAGELYVAPMYNALIGAGRKIYYDLIPAENVIFCGVPAQYEALRAGTRARDERAGWSGDQPAQLR